MNILVLGAGNMGTALAGQFVKAGHKVSLAARSLDKARRVASDIPGTSAVSAAGSAAIHDVIVVATPYAQAVTALHAIGPFDGQVVVDVTNPLNADHSGLTLGDSTSAAEQIARAVPGTDVVKAFNTLFAQVVVQGAAFPAGQTARAFYASDSARAKATVRTLIESIGFLPVDAGSLKNARYLELLAGLKIWFRYGAGQWTGIAPAWMTR